VKSEVLSACKSVFVSIQMWAVTGRQVLVQSAALPFLFIVQLIRVSAAFYCELILSDMVIDAMWFCKW
jgi:hypothetical protein